MATNEITTNTTFPWRTFLMASFWFVLVPWALAVALFQVSLVFLGAETKASAPSHLQVSLDNRSGIADEN